MKIKKKFSIMPFIKKVLEITVKPKKTILQLVKKNNYNRFLERTLKLTIKSIKAYSFRERTSAKNFCFFSRP